MTRDDIASMAREAGFIVDDCLSGPNVWVDDGYYIEELERFAALVAAAELRRLHEENTYLKEVYEDLVEDRKELFDDLDKAVAAEREACAKVCEELPNTFKIAAEEFGYTAEQPTAENYAAAIRTRGEE